MIYTPSDHRLRHDRSLPFSIDDKKGYLAWRESKLDRVPSALDEITVEVSDLSALTKSELDSLLQGIERTNFVVYRTAPNAKTDKVAIQKFGNQVGLHRLDHNLFSDADSISALRVVDERRQGEYIPYTNRALSWHTDGYYNSPSRAVCGLIMHCVRPAERGGENRLMDHELAYIRLRDQNSDYIDALMQPDCMTIPANIVDGRVIRDTQSGPVFSIGPSGTLHMRYSARQRNIVWKDDATVRMAVAALNELLADAALSFTHRLEAGEGLLTNNVLHNRSAFEDRSEPGRLMYRARYYDRVRVDE